ncbi:MAG: LLM class flavin-dependent oxidoreductase [Acidimicrobiia bacterium]
MAVGESLKFGVHTGPQNCTFAELRSLWQRAEEAKLWWVSVWDHFYPAQSAETGPCFEGVAAQTALAASTSTVRVGCLVYCAAYRNPAMLAKAAATIDHVSGGRVELGLGAGWHDGEFRAFGVPFLSAGERVSQMEEAATIIRSLWDNERTTFAGRYYSVDDAVFAPKMVQPQPRLWFGAQGRRGLAITARFGGGWNCPFSSPDEFARRSALIDATCGTIGRDPSEIMRAVNLGLALAATPRAAEAKKANLREQFGPMSDAMLAGMLVGTPQQAIERIGEYRERGCDLVIAALRAPFDLESYELFLTDVVPAFSK